MESVAAVLGFLPHDVVRLIVDHSATECHVCRRKLVRRTVRQFEFCSRECYEYF